MNEPKPSNIHRSQVARRNNGELQKVRTLNFFGCVSVYRFIHRGKSDCGDIDILITRPVNDDKTHSGMII